MIEPNEQISSYSHIAGACFFAAGTVYLLIISRGSAPLFLCLLVYGISVTMLFMASSLYHASKKEENDETILRKFDHIAIFFMIAGTYTPPTYAYLAGGWRVGILTAQWSLVLFGVLFKFFYLSAPRALSAGIYVLMGWIAIIPIYKFYAAMPTPVFFLFITGGVAFTTGAIIYAAKKPDPFPDRFGFHEIFHLFILAGAALHFRAMLFLLPG
jgi:hemolysin III